MLGSILGGLAGGLAQGAFGYFGQKETNTANAQQAQKQMDFQERMSNTAHQREVQDLQKAGLNPILSAGGSGSSTPAGASATMGNTMSHLGEGLKTGVSTAMQLKTMEKEFQQKDATIALANAQTATQLKQQELLSASARKQNAEATDYEGLLGSRKESDYYTNKTASETSDFYKKLQYNVETSAPKYTSAKAQTEMLKMISDMAEMRTNMKRNELENSQLEFDKRAQTYDSIMKRIQSALNAGSSAASIIKPGITLKNEIQDSTNYHRVHKKTGEIK